MCVEDPYSHIRSQIAYVATFRKIKGEKPQIAPLKRSLYCKRQKLSERKVLQFIGFHPNVGKTCAIFASSV